MSFSKGLGRHALFFVLVTSLSVLNLPLAQAKASSTVEKENSPSLFSSPSASNDSTERGASQADADELSRLVQSYLQQNTDNPGHAQRQLDEVRRKLVALQKSGVKVQFDPLLLDDAQLTKKIYSLIDNQKVADKSGKIGMLGHGILVCIAFVLCHLNPVAPMPEGLGERPYEQYREHGLQPSR